MMSGNFVTGPPLPVRAFGDADLAHLEGQARKLIDKTLRLTHVFVLASSMAFVLAGAFMFIGGFLAPSYGIFLFVFGGMYLSIGLLSLVIGLPSSPYLFDKKIKNMRDWQDYFTKQDRSVFKDEPRGKLECLMMMTASMEGWLETAHGAETNSVTRSLLVVTTTLMALNFFPGLGLAYLVFIAIDLGALALVFIAWGYLFFAHRKEMAFWRPRLMAYSGWFNGYWGSL